MVVTSFDSVEGSAARRWILPSVEILSVGLPFCAFKALTGFILWEVPGAAPIGFGLLLLGAIDLGLNLVNLLFLLGAQRRLGAVCLTELLWRRFGRKTGTDLGLALDVLLSFSLVALVVGLGWIPRLPAGTAPVWNVAVVLNVLGAGIGRVISALMSPRMRTEEGA